MSLINQMLKDLARRSRPLSDPDIILSGLATTTFANSKKNKIRYLLISIVFLTMLMIAQTWMIPKSHHANLLQFISESPSISRPQVNSKPELAQNPAVLTGITLQVQNEISNLRLLLNQNALYRISNAGKDRLIIVLENTQLATSLPQIDTMNSAVKMIKMTNQIDGSLKIMLTLNAGAELTHLELNEPNKLPELQIDLLYKNIDAGHNQQTGDVVEAQQKSPIKKVSYDTSIEDEYRRAMNFSIQGQNIEAIAQLTRFLAKYPAFIPARKSLVTLLLKQGNIAKAERVLNTGLQLQPEYTPYILLKAEILVNKGKNKEALNLLQLSPPSLEENPDYHAFIAALYQRQSKFQLAEKLYEQLLNLQPNNSIWWMGLGVARESLNKNKEALVAYTKANNTDNLSPELKVYVETRMHALLG